MRFLIDAQLPKKFTIWLLEAGHDAIHTLDLPNKNSSTDLEVMNFALHNARIVISKDDDFFKRLSSMESHHYFTYRPKHK